MEDTIVNPCRSVAVRVGIAAVRVLRKAVLVGRFLNRLVTRVPVCCGRCAGVFGSCCYFREVGADRLVGSVICRLACDYVSAGLVVLAGVVAVSAGLSLVVGLSGIGADSAVSSTEIGSPSLMWLLIVTTGVSSVSVIS